MKSQKSKVFEDTYAQFRASQQIYELQKLRRSFYSFARRALTAEVIQNKQPELLAGYSPERPAKEDQKEEGIRYVMRFLAQRKIDSQPVDGSELSDADEHEEDEVPSLIGIFLAFVRRKLLRLAFWERRFSPHPSTVCTTRQKKFSDVVVSLGAKHSNKTGRNTAGSKITRIPAGATKAFPNRSQAERVKESNAVLDMLTEQQSREKNDTSKKEVILSQQQRLQNILKQELKKDNDIVL